MRKIIVAFLILVVFASCKSRKIKEQVKEDKNQTVKDALTAELDSIHANGLINGFSVAIVNKNKVLYTKGFGYANVETKEKYTENTVQHIASVSKTLIGIALMKAQELGKLKLEDPIQNYLPFKVINPNFPDEKITLRHLATHTSGINDTDQYLKRAWVLYESQDLSNVRTDYPEQKLNASKLNIPMEDYLKGYLAIDGAYYDKGNYLHNKAGERYNYSNIGASLCALVIEKATGQSFDTFTEKYILQPLEMTTTAWSIKDVDIKKHSRLYRNDNSLLPFYTAITYPDGMLISSSKDMAKYLIELIKGYCGEGTILSPESYNELYRAQLEEHHFISRNANHPYDGDYNPAIFIGHSALGYIGHSGGDAGVATWLYFDKEKKSGRYIVINTDMGNDERVRELEYYAIWEKMGEYIEKLDDKLVKYEE